MKRPVQHVMEDKAGILLRRLLPPEWIVRPIARDYGIDYEVELVDEDVVTGNRIWVQLKGVAGVEVREARFEFEKRYFKSAGSKPAVETVTVPYVAFSIETKELLYSLRCPFPLLLFVADLSSDEIYWL